MSKRLEDASKFLSLVLRHKPDVIGLTLDVEGWADVDRLVELSSASGKTLSRALVEEVVASSDKQRFALSSDRSRIRANQGHSIAVDLKLVPRVPPNELFHGTATRFVASIVREGLLPQSRQHVHLSTTTGLATIVGSRHGRPVVLVVRALQMHADGHVFHMSENGVWLTACVPPAYLVVAADG